MLSFKNSILKIERTTDGKSFGMLFEICLYLCFALYFVFYKERVATTASFAIGTAATFFITVGKIKSSRLSVPIVTVWYLLFFAFAELSAAWAYVPYTAAFTYIKQMIFIIILGFGMCQYVDTHVDFERLLTIFQLATLLLALSELLFYPWQASSVNNYFGATVSGLNANSFSFLMMASAIIGFYKGYIRNKKLWYIPTLIFIICSFLSSSRKSAIMSLVGIMFIILFSFGKPRHILHFILAFVVTVSVIFACIKIDFLYDIIGKRFESMINYYIDPSKAQTESSLLYRSYFIQFAKQLFYEKPALGHGFSNFSILLLTESTVNKWLYAHNNYWEILADLGVVGFILYYWFYAYLGIRSIIKLIKNRQSYTATLAIALLGTLMIVEWGIVSMSYLFPQIVVVLIFTAVYVDDSSAQKKYRYIQSSKGGRRIA